MTMTLSMRLVVKSVFLTPATKKQFHVACVICGLRLRKWHLTPGFLCLLLDLTPKISVLRGGGSQTTPLRSSNLVLVL